MCLIFVRCLLAVAQVLAPLRSVRDDGSKKLPNDTYFVLEEQSETNPYELQHLAARFRRARPPLAVVYMTPDKLRMNVACRNLLAAQNVWRVVIDEAHLYEDASKFQTRDLCVVRENLLREWFPRARITRQTPALITRVFSDSFLAREREREIRSSRRAFERKRRESVRAREVRTRTAGSRRPSAATPARKPPSARERERERHDLLFGLETCPSPRYDGFPSGGKNEFLAEVLISLGFDVGRRAAAAAWGTLCRNSITRGFPRTHRRSLPHRRHIILRP